MSYDIDVSNEEFNYTVNMRQFFVDFDVFPKDWDGVHRDEVAAQIDHALKLIGMHDIELLKEAYDSPNGWGKVENAITFLRKVRAACVREMHDPNYAYVW